MDILSSTICFVLDEKINQRFDGGEGGVEQSAYRQDVFEDIPMPAREGHHSHTTEAAAAPRCEQSKILPINGTFSHIFQ